ncbi:VanZ family protein [Aeromicrobium wangtongii]|uniref:VanZ family protein n=1 Tax=Aeromicrobium wangtongii TaxID=2969247 RepID=A0ABY5M6P5_9ACTN|nr:VanZ family protein [Aeromicrobium wangtongii]MCD9199477.1 VanZ family protein [Aeromicrobium wangtongii]UUP13830.1 VanZ family protein [Aeromicrobium wangtongii]
MRARWIILVAGAYALALALIGLWPTRVDRNVAVTDIAPVAWALRQVGLDPGQGYHLIEFTANIALFVPLGILILLWRTDWGWWQATAVAFCVSATIEVLQDVLRPDRVASVNDVIANTAGGAVGALLVVAARRRVPALRR